MIMIAPCGHLRKAAAVLGACALTSLGGLSGAAPHRALGIPSGGTVIAAEAQIQGTLNPFLNQALATADVDSAVFDGLGYYDDKGVWRPDIATRYTHDAKGLHWTFFLNPKATWQDGVPVTAKDYVFTTNLVNNPKFGATATLGYDHIKTIKAVGAHEIDITLTSVYAPFLAYWGTSAALPEHILGKIAPDKIKNDTAYNQKPLGDGPFQITEDVSGDHITEKAYKSYFRGAPHLDKIIFRIVPSNNTAINQIQTGELSLLGQTSSLSARQFNLLKRFPNIRTYNTPGVNWAHLDLIETGFFKDARVRRALAYATPKQQIINQVLLGYGSIADGDQLPGTPWYNPAIKNSYPYNPAKARSLFMADGFKVGANGILQKNGKPLTIYLWGGSGQTDVALTTQIIKNAWTKVGIDTRIKLISSSILFGSQVGPLEGPDRLSSPNTNAILYAWNAGATEPDDSYFWASNQIPNKQRAAGGNSDGYVNPEIDRLTAQGVATLDQAQRAAIYKEIQAILVRDQPDIFLNWSRVLTAAVSKLHGYDPQPYSTFLAWNAKDWYMTP
jgi:peptide/nickel transport system substrate-binding protein